MLGFRERHFLFNRKYALYKSEKMKKILTLTIALIVCSLNTAAIAQTPLTRETYTEPNNASLPNAESADISITSNVTASELRFQVVPNVKIEFLGTPNRYRGWQTEKQNLPNPIEPGVTYRDIGIRLQINSLFSSECKVEGVECEVRSGE